MKPAAIRDLRALLVHMRPALDERAWVFARLPDDAVNAETAFAVVREEEGACAILPASLGPKRAPYFARITLQVHSDLEAVGLTAAVATVLASSGIACNIVAGLHHDHLFVPYARRDKALELLETLSNDASR